MVMGMAPKEEWRRKWAAERMLPKEEALERVLRYEAHLHRQLLQTMHELEALQARRRGEWRHWRGWSVGRAGGMRVGIGLWILDYEQGNVGLLTVSVMN